MVGPFGITLAKLFAEGGETEKLTEDQKSLLLDLMTSREPPT